MSFFSKIIKFTDSGKNKKNLNIADSSSIPEDEKKY